MSSLSYAMTDSSTMIRRQMRHMIRYPSLTVMLVGMPVVFLLLFVYVFGGTLGAGLGGGAAGRNTYLVYVVPGILLMTIAGGAQGTAISVAMDMTEGIVARFRTMAISRASVLVGHVVGSLVQTMISIAVVLGAALLIGFRPSAGPIEWAAIIGLLALATFAVTWLSVAFGMVTNSVETASNIPMFLMLMPFLGSGFVPTASMPAAIRWFAEYQPFTPIMETLRGLLMGSPIGGSGMLAVGWCVAIALLGFLWSVRLYERNSAR